MAEIQMWPQNQGLRNSVSYDGRTYSSIPGVPIEVYDFDVAVLQAKGWTTYPTVAVKTTITMLSPANAVYNTISFDDRTYATTPGVPIEALPFDVPTLEANGWTLVLVAAVPATVIPSGWPDGREGAPEGSPQYPAILADYGLNRPPWNVAGVDYRVGVPEGQSMVDWRTLSGPAIFVNTTTGRVDTNQLPDASVTFDNVDFSLGIGAMVYNNQASSITFNNCKFALPGGGGSYSNTVFAVIHDQNAANVTVNKCSFDATDMPNHGTFVSSSGNVTLTYNLFKFTRQHILEWNATSNKSVIYKYNFIDDALLADGAHLNYFQPFVDATVTCDIQFNTAFRQGLFGGNGFQFGSGFSTAIFLNPIFQNNTLIAKLDSTGNVSMSYFASGIGPGAGTLSGIGTNNYNYFDLTGTFGAYYPGRMTPALGWSSSGNIDMNTGAIITPP